MDNYGNALVIREAGIRTFRKYQTNWKNILSYFELNECETFVVVNEGALIKLFLSESQAIQLLSQLNSELRFPRGAVLRVSSIWVGRLPNPFHTACVRGRDFTENAMDLLNKKKRKQVTLFLCIVSFC
jgi:hypothetical protein